MGWNASASMVMVDYWGPGKDDIKHIPDTHPARADFVKACKALAYEGLSHDCTLDIGQLCLRSTGQALFGSIGQPMMHSGVFTSADVQYMARKADWSVSSDKYERSHMETAKAFLDVCSKHNLCIDFG